MRMMQPLGGAGGGFLAGALLGLLVGCSGSPPPVGTRWSQGARYGPNGKYHPPITVTYIGGGKLQVNSDCVGGSTVTAGSGGDAETAGSGGSADDTDSTQNSNAAVVDVSSSDWVEISWDVSLKPKRFKV